MQSAHTTIRRAGLATAAFGAMAVLLALTAAPGVAFEGYGESYRAEPQVEFGESGTGDGQFSRTGGVAVNEATGDVYVVDKGNGRVEEFDAEGKYLAQFDGSEAPTGQLSGPAGIAVDNSKGATGGDVYVIDAGHDVIDVFDAAGKYLTQITGPSTPFERVPNGVAVDGSGDVWATVGGGIDEVYEFSPGGVGLVSQFKTEDEPRSGIAVDPSGGSSGLVYVVSWTEENKALLVYTTRGQEVAQWAVLPSENFALAVNEVSHDLFLEVNEYPEGIKAFGPFGVPYGQPIGELFGAKIPNPSGLAVNARNGNLYTGEQYQDGVAVFKTFPAALTVEVTADAGATATVSGLINPNGKPTTYHFQYGETNAYGSSTPPRPAGENEIAAAQAAELTGLKAGTTYHYRVVAENENGASYGEDRTFTSLPPIVSTGAASAVSQTEATISGTVESRGLQTSYEFELGTSTSYGGAKLFGNAGRSAGPETVGATLQYLVPGTTYHYRLIATNEDGTTDGADQSFTTPEVTNGLAVPASAPLLAIPAFAFPAEEAVTQPKAKHKAKHRKTRKKRGRKTSGKHGAKGGRKA
jgi:hypothetical protein